MDLSKRLAKVATLILPADVLADVGCDHGYLAIYLAEHKICRRIIAMDVNKSPLQKAAENIEKYGYGSYIETRLSDGLDKLDRGEAEGYVCAGMGGPLALQIMWNDRDKIKDMKQIILQPQSELWLVRRTLKRWGFVIEKEDVEYEDGKFYFMMRISPGPKLAMDCAPDADSSLWQCTGENSLKQDEMQEEDLRKAAYELFAEELLEQRNPNLKEYILREKSRLAEVYETLGRQKDSPKSDKRRKTVAKELAVLEWALARYER